MSQTPDHAALIAEAERVLAQSAAITSALEAIRATEDAAREAAEADAEYRRFYPQANPKENNR